MRYAYDSLSVSDRTAELLFRNLGHDFTLEQERVVLGRQVVILHGRHNPAAVDSDADGYCIGCLRKKGVMDKGQCLCQRTWTVCPIST